PVNERSSARKRRAQSPEGQGPRNVAAPVVAIAPDGFCHVPLRSIAFANACVSDGVPEGPVARNDLSPVTGSIRACCGFDHWIVGYAYCPGRAGSVGGPSLRVLPSGMFWVVKSCSTIFDPQDSVTWCRAFVCSARLYRFPSRPASAAPRPTTNVRSCE